MADAGTKHVKQYMSDKQMESVNEARKWDRGADMLSRPSENDGTFTKLAKNVVGMVAAKKADDAWKDVEKNTRTIDKDERKMLLSRASDRNLKEDIEESPSAIQKFLGNVKPYEYEYKEPEKFGEGKHVGPMAQDLEKSELGARMVEETPDGKMVNYGKGLSTMMASIAYLNEELEKLKKGKK